MELGTGTIHTYTPVRRAAGGAAAAAAAAALTGSPTAPKAMAICSIHPFHSNYFKVLYDKQKKK